MKFGCCMPGGSFMPQGQQAVPGAAEAQITACDRKITEAGYDYSEMGAGFLDRLTEEEMESLEARKQAGSLSVSICNSFIPGTYSVFRPECREALLNYVEKVLSRASRLGIGIMVFGSGAARQVPLEMTQEQAFQKMADFLRICREYAKKYRVILALEPLNHRECNLFNTVGQCAEMVRYLNLPEIQLIADAFHTWVEQEDLSVLARERAYLVHVHVAEPPDRLYPGKDGGRYLTEFARALKNAGYSGTVSVECGFREFDRELDPALKFLKECFV